MSRLFLIPLIVACALFMENRDSTIITTSLPAIAQDLHENPLALNLALTAYLASLAVFIPISGWVADRYGSRSAFAAAIVVFVIGSQVKEKRKYPCSTAMRHAAANSSSLTNRTNRIWSQTVFSKRAPLSANRANGWSLSRM